MRLQFIWRSRCGVRSAIGVLVLAVLIIPPGCGRARDSGTEGVAEQGSKAETTPNENSVAGASQETPLPENDDGAGEKPVAMMKFEEANGFEIYQRYCATCHGDAGDGQGFNAFNLDPKPRSHIDKFARESVTDEELTRSIALGGAGRGKSPLMPRWGRTLNPRKIRYVIAYIRLLQRQAQVAEAVSEAP